MRRSRRRSSLIFGMAAALSFGLAVSGPIDARSDASFAWHMAQHLALLFVVPLFVLLAHPLEWFGSPRARWRRGLVRLARSAPVRGLCSPATCLLIFIGVLWGTHFTPLYEAALEHPLIHIGEHLLLLTTGLFFWLPIVAPPPLPVPPHPVRALYLFMALPQGALLAVALLAARHPLYPHYAGPLAMADQHAAAAVMWVGGGAIVFGAFITIMARWAVRERYAAGAAALAVIATGLMLPKSASAAVTAVPSYSGTQARAGQTLFYENCAECHGAFLEGNYGPALAGNDGNIQWDTVKYVYTYMRQHMPVGNADGLSKEQYLDIMAFLLASHHHPSGPRPLTEASASASTAKLGPLAP
jgi:putative membrane protein